MKVILHQTSIWIILLPLITGLWFSKKLSHKSLIIVLLVVVATPPQLASTFFSEKYSNILYNIYTPLEFFILYYFFKGRFYLRICNNIFKASFVLFYCISVAILLHQKSIGGRFISEWVSLENLFYLLWILIYFADQYKLPQMELTLNNPFCWALIGIFIYAACTPVHFVLYDVIEKSYLSIFQSSFNILLYILLTVSFFKDKMLKRII